jgi:hypothetical protein
MVAIKFLSTEIADESARRRFQQEAKIASSLSFVPPGHGCAISA